MKKFLFLLLTVALVLALAACKPACTEHVDTDTNGKCDNCGADVEVPCTEHVDEDTNGKCDNCGTDVEVPCTEHVDKNNNGECDNCGAAVEIRGMTKAEFDAAELDTQVVIDTYIQAKQGWWNNKGVDVATFYTQNSEGGYLLYNMPCSEAEYNALVPGTRVLVTGYKAEWSGEVEIIDATFEILEGSFIPEATDITASVRAGESILAHQNKLISLNAFVAAAPKYNWNGSGSYGNDIYLDVTIGNETVTLVVESYLHGKGSEVYETVKDLSVGDAISVEAFLYWYEGPQPHINSVEVAEVTDKAGFDAAAIDDRVVVITYIQAKQSWWNNNGVDVATFYAQGEDGGYLLYNMPCSEAEFNALVPGTKVAVSGYKAEWSGEVEIIDATFAILEGTYTPTATDITELIANGTDVTNLQNSLVKISGTVSAAPKYNWNGSGSYGNDIYLELTVGEEKITVVVESYLHGKGSDVYETVKDLAVGDVISVEAFLYWYEGPQPHINAISVNG